ncbi:hypothetical protein, partial [Corynebacterium sp. HMSC062E11]|uniref:hypothetical protein n=1 Tax=Corynebacterium sp. HMSC062E11 TaxID=1739326 RepID=UPI001E589B25
MSLRETDYLPCSPCSAQRRRASIDVLEASDKGRLTKGISHKAFSRPKTPFTQGGIKRWIVATGYLVAVS